MSHVRCVRILRVAALVVLGSLTASAQQIKTVFVIAMENHNWTQPANQFTGGIQQIYQNPNAPFINSLVNGNAFAVVNNVSIAMAILCRFSVQRTEPNAALETSRWCWASLRRERP